jgi:Cation transporter/ATPase, N-terminus
MKQPTNSIAAPYIHRSDLCGVPLSNDGADDRTRLWTPSRTTFRFFLHRNAKYVWNSETETYARLHGYDRGEKLHRFRAELAAGLSECRQSALRLLYGPNTIDVEVKSYLRLLFQEVLNPFYIFQIASIILWSLDSYYYYGNPLFIGFYF